VRRPGPAPPPLRGAQRRPARPSAAAPRRHRGPAPAPAPQVRCLHDSKQTG